MIDQQSHVDRDDVLIGWVIESLIGQVRGVIKQCLIGFFAHAGIVHKGQGGGYSYFPSVGFVHDETVSQGNANKNVQGASA